MNFVQIMIPANLLLMMLSIALWGFRRTNGNVGTRNYIAIVTSVNCSATAARKNC